MRDSTIAQRPWPPPWSTHAVPNLALARRAADGCTATARLDRTCYRRAARVGALNTPHYNRPMLRRALLLLAIPVLAWGQRLSPATIDALVTSSMREWHVPGVAIAVVENYKVTYLKGYGVSETGKATAVTPDTLFAIASTTKAFTTAGLAILADEGKISWDDPVRRYLPYFHLSDPLA